MPISSVENKKPVMDLLKEINAKNILELGVGYGTFAPMIKTQIKNCRIFGIEIFEPYFEKIPKNCYERLYNDDIRTFEYEKKFFSNVEIHCTLIIDVLEHLEKNEALELLKTIEQKSPDIIISVPIIDIEQGSFLGNIHETHKVQWKIKDLIDLGYSLVFEGNVIGVFYKQTKKKEKINYT